MVVRMHRFAVVVAIAKTAQSTEFAIYQSIKSPVLK